MKVVKVEIEREPLRLWPGVAIVALMWLNWFVLPILLPDKGYFGMLGGAVGGLLVALWWVFFSRAPWSERLGAVALMVVAVIATRSLLHESMATTGQGVLYYIYAIPVLATAFVLWAVVTRNLTGRARWATMVAAIVVGCGVWALVRTGGISNSGGSDFAWRWSKTSEERMLAASGQPRGHTSGDLLTFRLVQTTEADHYRLSEAAEAFRLVGEVSSKGKVVITV